MPRGAGCNLPQDAHHRRVEWQRRWLDPCLPNERQEISARDRMRSQLERLRKFSSPGQQMCGLSSFKATARTQVRERPDLTRSAGASSQVAGVEDLLQ